MFTTSTIHQFATPSVTVDRTWNGFFTRYWKKLFAFKSIFSGSLYSCWCQKDTFWYQQHTAGYRISRIQDALSSFGGGQSSRSYEVFGKYFTSYVRRRFQRICWTNADKSRIITLSQVWWKFRNRKCFRITAMSTAGQSSLQGRRLTRKVWGTSW